MSGYTTPSEFNAKSHGRKSSLSQGQEPPWAFLPLGYRASAVASAMSGQFPPPSASPPIPYTAHHLPPAAPTPGQYPPAPQQRLRVPTLGSSPPPAQGHIPPWGHSTQSSGLSSLSGNLGYFGPPHIGGLGGPGRGQPQPWQAGPKPTTHPAGGNPLFSLQMLVTQEATSAGGAVSSMRPVDDYQQETMDLSSHSGSTVIDDHQSVRKDSLRNGGIVSNGEIGNSSEERKSPAKPADSVSVIAHNPLRETQESVISTVLNCSSKPEPKPSEKVLECSSSVKTPTELTITEKLTTSSSSGTSTEVKLIISSSDSSVEKTVAASSVTITEKVVPSMVTSVEKVVVPSIGSSTEKTIISPSGSKVEHPIKTSLSILPVDKPVISSSGSSEKLVVSSVPIIEKTIIPSLSMKVTDDWEGSNHTPDNVESILENMFQTQEEKSSSGALPLVVAQSVIVTNDSRSSLQIDMVTKSSGLIDKPASPEKINEQKLAEILKVEEPDVEMISERKHEVKKEILRDLKSEESSLNSVKVEKVKVVPNKDQEKDKSSIVVKEENIPMESTSSDDVKPSTSESEGKSGQSSDVSSQRTSSSDVNAKQLIEGTPDVPVSSSAPVETEGIESAKNAFIEVESELEKMFAGIVEPGSEGLSAVKVESSPSSSTVAQSNTPSVDRKRLTAQEKRRGRPKGTPARRSSDSVYSIDSSQKKKQKRPGDVDKKTKKTKLDSGRDSPIVKRGRGAFVKDASNDSGSTVGVKSKGPLIHIEGSKESPTSVIIVNSGVRTSDEDESSEKISKAPFRKHTAYPHQKGRSSKIVGSGLYNSTLSSRYDSHTPDATWICVFCKRGPHCGGGLGGEPAGDLYGPYIISSVSVENSSSPRGVPSDKDIVEEQKRRGGGKQASIRATGGAEQFVQKIARKHKRSISVDSESGLVGMVPIAGEKNDYEVWVHEQCAIWAPGMYLIGSKLVGLQEAVWAAVKVVCSKCGEPGASISCVTRGCPLLLHYGCAVLEGWQLDVGTFIAKCRSHVKGAGFFPSGVFIKSS
ncbi:uncharacterized protein LOC142329712 isoform X2 [Lycorma delicatula]|uniref:uncharacterized protein LOC142329712 isoform X2 n=1 Tax=Lycorma delicatula TaxID=130591 RepID=UPI003F5149D0